MEPVLEVRGLSKRFGDVAALVDVSFVVEGPQLVGILGPNGAGKTTLLDIVEGLTTPDAGTALLFGRALHGPTRTAYPRGRVGIVMQNEFRMDHVTAAEYAALFAAIHRVDDGAQKVLAAAELTERARTPLGRLSGGEAARLFIGAAVVHEPALVFLDEPTAALDPGHKRRVGEMLRRMSQERTVVMTTHDLREADLLCDHLVFLVDGAVHAAGPRSELVSAVPPEARRGVGVEDAFFHFCSIRIERGEAQSLPSTSDEGAREAGSQAARSERADE